MTSNDPKVCFHLIHTKIRITYLLIDFDVNLALLSVEQISDENSRKYCTVIGWRRKKGKIDVFLLRKFSSWEIYSINARLLYRLLALELLRSSAHNLVFSIWAGRVLFSRARGLLRPEIIHFVGDWVLWFLVFRHAEHKGRPE